MALLMVGLSVGEVVGASTVAVAAAGNVPKQGGIAKN